MLELIFYLASAIIISIAAGCVLWITVHYSVDGESFPRLIGLVSLFIFLVIVAFNLLLHLLK